MTRTGLTLLLALAALFAAACTRRKEPEVAKRPNVLLITVDTLRADRLGCYGFEPARTPAIDKLATQGIRVEHAVASAPTTLPSHTSILTGLEPPAHGVRDNGTYRVPDEIQTLAEQLKTAGYRTQAFVSAEVLHHRYGLDQGFDGYDDQLWGEEGPQNFMFRERSGDKTTDRVLQWLNRPLAATESAVPFLLWVHLFDPHQPYSPPGAYAKVGPTRYDGEIAFADAQVGRLVDALSQKGVLDDTIVVLTADHGESLGEHDELTHAVFIYESTVRVPLIFRYPRKLQAGRVHEESVRSVDLMPTILSLAGVTPNQTQGTDLSKALVSADPPPALPQYSESLQPELAFGMAPLYGLRLGEWTYIRAPRPELYNRANDPGELANLLGPPGGAPSGEDAKNRASELSGLLDDLLKQSESLGFVAQGKPLDDATAEMLQALGYMGESVTSDSLRGLDPKDGVEIYAKIDEGFQLVHDGDYPGAIAALSPLLDRLPNLVAARNTIAKCELFMGNPAAAKKQYLKSLEYDPRQEEVHLQLGRMQLAEGDLQGARERFTEALRLIPKSVDAMILLGYVELGAGRRDEAKRWYEKAIEADPSRPNASLSLAELYFSEGDPQKAGALVSKALEVTPNSVRALLLAGFCELGVGNSSGAERHLLRANQIEPGQWQPLYGLACVQATKGDSDAAVTYLERAIGAGFSDAQRLRQDPCFAALSDVPRFDRLTKALGGVSPH